MDPAKQVLVKKEDRLRIVKMDAMVEKTAEKIEKTTEGDK
jgi:NADH-quinone oxidoreductase subunit J